MLAARLRPLILAKLLEANADFRGAYHENPTSTEPVVTVYADGEGPFAEDKNRLKRRYVLRADS